MKTLPSQKNIGKTIRQDRKAIGMTLKDLATSVGIGVATLHRIESGSSSPSLNLLLRIAKRINRPLVSFFQGNDKGFEQRAGDDIDLIETENLSFKVIAPYGLIHPDIVIWHVSAKAGTTYDSQPEDGYEWAYILKGKLVVNYEGKIYAVNEGDIVFCDGRKLPSVTVLEDTEHFYAIRRETKTKAVAKTRKAKRSVGEIIREDRKLSGLTLKQLAKKVGIGATNLQRIESGSSSPSLNLLLRIAKRINRPVTRLLRSESDDFYTRESDEIELIETEYFSFRVIAPYGLIRPDIVIWHVNAKAGTTYDSPQEEEYEWVYILKGKLVIDYGGKIYAVNEGDMCCSDGTKHCSLRVLEDVEYIYACRKNT